MGKRIPTGAGTPLELIELTAEAVGKNRIDLSWDDDYGMALYLSYRNQQEETWTMVELWSSTRQYSLVMLPTGTAYEFQLFSRGRLVSNTAAATAE